MINATTYAIQKSYGVQTTDTMESAVVAALALTPYVRFIDEKTGVSNYFNDVTKNCTRYIEQLNEVYPMNVDVVLMRAKKVFMTRYAEVIWADPASVLAPTNKVHQVFLENSTVIPPNEIVRKLLTKFQKLVQSGSVGGV